MFSIIAQGAQSKNKKVLILVHRKEILEQTLSKLFDLGVQSGQIAPGKPITRDLIQTAMVGTLVRRLDKIPRPDLIIIDECHHSVAGQWLKIINHFRDVPKLGWTATPERLDGAGLGNIFDCMIKGPTINNLVNAGYLSYPVMYRPPKEMTEKFHIKRGDFDKDEQVEAMTKKHIIGDVIDHYRKYMDGLPAVCFCVSILHCEIMEKQFNQAGYKAKMVYGNMPRSEREAAIKGLADGTYNILTSCDVISEGVDVPVMAGCILLRKTLSLSLYLQQVGRALRKFPGKEKAIILDHAGNYYLHGHILVEREWSLDAKKRDRKKDKPPTTTSCPKCFAVWPGEPKKCPACNFIFNQEENKTGNIRKTPEVIAGDLIAALPGADQETIRELTQNIGKIQNMSPEVRQKYMLKLAFQLQDRQQIKALADAVGYKPGWTNYIWRNILGNR
jgi:superfamily II DNA or RNA helicase